MILGIPNFKKPPYGSVTGLSETCGVYPQKMTINPCFLGYLIFRQTLQYILKLTKTLGVLSISIHFRGETPCEESTGISASEVVDQLIIIFHDFPICSPLKDIWTIQISLAPFWGKSHGHGPKNHLHGAEVWNQISPPFEASLTLTLTSGCFIVKDVWNKCNEIFYQMQNHMQLGMIIPNAGCFILIFLIASHLFFHVFPSIWDDNPQSNQCSLYPCGQQAIGGDDAR